jgi:flagellar biosynthetic protein FliO
VTTTTELPGYGAFLVETLVILAVVCALAWVILKYGVRRGGLRQAGLLKVVARLPLEPRRTLYVVEAPGKTLLIGVSEGAIATLAELDPTQVGDVVAAGAAGAEGRRSFLEVWRGVTGKAGSESNPKPKPQP